MASITSVGTINTFISGTVITAAGHNTNWTTLLAWSNGQIQQDNLGTMTGTITWSVTTNSLAISSTNTGTEGSATFAHNGTLASGKSAVKITSNAAQSTGTALLELAQSSASANIPALKVTDAGAGPSAALHVVSTTKGAINAPVMTTTQRDAIVTPAEGTEIWNSTLKRKEIYNGSFWVAAAGNSGQIVDWPGAGTLPSYLVECDGSTLSVNGTNAYAISILSTTWGGSGQLPDLRGRTRIGAGTGSGLTSRTIAANVGAETHQLTSAEMPSHSHAVTGTTATDAHSHFLFSNQGADDGQGLGDSKSVNSRATGIADNSYVICADSSDNNPNIGRSQTDTHDHTMNFTSGNTGSGGSHNNMQPSQVFRPCMVL